MSIQLPSAPPNPWKKLGTKKIYANKWMELYEDSVVRPDASRGIYGKPIFPYAIAVIALRPDGRTLIIGQWRYLRNQYTWEVPAGACEKGENALVAAKRELKEETGLTGRSWTPIGRITMQNIVQEADLFLVENIIEGKQQTEVTEVIKTHWLPFHDALQLVQDDMITDWLSAIALLRADHFLRSRK